MPLRGKKSLQIDKNASFLSTGWRGGNRNSTRLFVACLTMRVTWCSNPCNLRNRGKNSVPVNRGETPGNQNCLTQTNWSLFLVLLFSCGRFKLNCFFLFWACTGQKRAKINGQSGADTSRQADSSTLRLQQCVKTYFLLIYDSTTESNIYLIYQRKLKENNKPSKNHLAY